MSGNSTNTATMAAAAGASQRQTLQQQMTNHQLTGNTGNGMNSSIVCM